MGGMGGRGLEGGVVIVVMLVRLDTADEEQQQAVRQTSDATAPLKLTPVRELVRCPSRLRGNISVDKGE